MDTYNVRIIFILVPVVLFLSGLDGKPESVLNQKLDTTLDHHKQSILVDLLQGKHITPAKYRKSFKITIPLKPTLLRYLHLPTHRPSIKRDLSKHGDLFKAKRGPILKSIDMLLDDVRSPNTKHADFTNSKTASKLSSNEDIFVIESGNGRFKLRKPHKEAALLAKTHGFQANKKVTATTTETPSPTTVSNTSSDESNDSKPSLLARISSDVRGNANGLNSGNSAAHNTSDSGSITRNNGDNKHDTGIEKAGATTEGYNKYTQDTTRDSTDGSSADRRDTEEFTLARNRPGDTELSTITNLNTSNTETETKGFISGTNTSNTETNTKEPISGTNTSNTETDTKEPISGTYTSNTETDTKGLISGTKGAIPRFENKDTNTTGGGEITQQLTIPTGLAAGVPANVSNVEKLVEAASHGYVGNNSSSHQGLIDGSSTNTIENQRPGRGAQLEEIVNAMKSQHSSEEKNPIEINGGYSQYKVNKS